MWLLPTWWSSFSFFSYSSDSSFLDDGWWYDTPGNGGCDLSLSQCRKSIFKAMLMVRWTCTYETIHDRKERCMVLGQIAVCTIKTAWQILHTLDSDPQPQDSKTPQLTAYLGAKVMCWLTSNKYHKFITIPIVGWSLTGSAYQNNKWQ